MLRHARIFYAKLGQDGRGYCRLCQFGDVRAY
jgi:hypothetical protein